MGKTKHPDPKAPATQIKTKQKQFRPSDLDTPVETPAPPPVKAKQARAVEKSAKAVETSEKAAVKPAAPTATLPDEDEDDEEAGEGGDEEPVEGGDESDKGFTRARKGQKKSAKKSAESVDEASPAQSEFNGIVRNRNSS